MESLRRAHQIDFTLPNQVRRPLLAWTKDVDVFLRGLETLATPESLQPAGQDAPAGTPAPETPIQPPIPAADQSSLLSSIYTDDVLESRTVQLVVRLVATLGHHSLDARTKAMAMLFQLAVKMDDKFTGSEKTFEGILSKMELDDYDTYHRVHELFQLIGKPLNNMVVAVVAGLECFHSSNDWHIRGICNTALARLVIENAKIFVEEDNLAAIWNLYFMLGSIPHTSNAFPDRIVIIKDFGLLAPVYASADASLTRCIVEGLLRIKVKTALETVEIKKTLQSVFANSKYDTTLASKNQGIGYGMFLNLITPNDEQSYDLLSWAFETYTLSIIPSTTAEATNQQRKVPANFGPLNELMTSLANHFRSSAPLVRYGACLLLHSALSLSATLLKENSHLFIFIATGLLDTDYMSSFLYLAMAENLGTPEVAQIKQITSNWRQRGVVLDHDTSLIRILELVVKVSPPLATKLLQKMASSLEYLSKPMKLRQLDLIRVWGLKAEKIDPFVLQTIVPFSNAPDMEIQHAAIRVLSAFLPLLPRSSPHDIQFVWSYTSKLLNNEVPTVLLADILSMAKNFPIDPLTKESRKNYLYTLYKLVFNRVPEIRKSVYQLIGDAYSIWTAGDLKEVACAMMVLCLGDGDKKCLEVVLENISGNLGIPLAPVNQFVIKVKDSVLLKSHVLLDELDNLANGILKAKVELGALMDHLMSPDLIDAFWDFFAADMPESQLVRIDDYNYNCVFVHSPFWTSLLLTKIGVPPPPVLNDPSVKRNQMPTTAYGKRRFVCSYMVNTLPMCAMSEGLTRKLACLTLVKCCFKGLALQNPMLGALLEYVSKQMILSKHWCYQLSSLNLLNLLVRLKIPGISASLVTQNMDQVLEILSSTTFGSIRVAALQFLEACMYIFPKGITYKLQEIRDVARTMLIEKDASVIAAAENVYKLVFRNALPTSLQDYEMYLQAELASISIDGAVVSGDPLLSKLDAIGLARIKCMDTFCLGLLNYTGSTYAQCQNILKHISDPDPDVRHAGLCAILSLIANLDPTQTACIMWTILPLYADPSKKVRLAFIQFLRNIPSSVESAALALPPSFEDNAQLPIGRAEDHLAASQSVVVEKTSLRDIVFEITELCANPQLQALPVDDDGFHLPTISEKLMKRFKILAQAVTGSVPETNTIEILFHLQDMQKTVVNQPNAILILSQFCCIHEYLFNDIVDVFVNKLNQDITPANTLVLQACMMGLKNIAQNSSGAFKQIMVKLTSSANINEGDILVHLFLLDLIKGDYVDRISELIKRFIGVVISPRHTARKRLYSVYLSIELALISEHQEDVTVVAESIQTFLESNTDPEIQDKIYFSLQKIIGHAGARGIFLKSLVGIAKNQIESKDAATRLKSLYLFPVFSKILSANECLWFMILYMADSSETIRRKAKVMFSEEGSLDPFLSVLQSAHSEPMSDTRKIILEACGFPTAQGFGLAVSENLEKTLSGVKSNAPMTEDSYNSKYYNSEQRKMLSKFFGLPDTLTQRATVPPTVSILQMTLEKFESDPESKIMSNKKNPWIADLNSTVILRELIRKNDTIVSELLSALIEILESHIRKDQAEDMDAALDIENLIHRVHVISNLLVAHDGVGDGADSWITRLQAIIRHCQDKAAKIRSSLFFDLESSFFFFNDLVDVPIVSDEQYEKLNNYRQASQEAALEIVKSGKVDKYSSLEEEREQLTLAVDVKSERLGILTSVALHTLSGVGAFAALTKTASEAQLVSHFQYLFQMLENEHRGVRQVAVEAMISMAQLQSETPSRPVFQACLEKTAQDLVAKLASEGAPLYRWKCDYLRLLGYLVIQLKSFDLTASALPCLVKAWRDMDSHVRQTSLQLVKRLILSGVFLPIPTYGPNLMENIASLMVNPEFPDKAALEQLLQARLLAPPLR